MNAAPFRSGRAVDPARLLPRRWEAGVRPSGGGLAAKLVAWAAGMAGRRGGG